MEKIIDTRGLACPEPVIMAKKALEEAKEVVVIADNDAVVENIRRLANKRGCAIAVVRDADGAFRIRLTRSGEIPPDEGTNIGIFCGICVNYFELKGQLGAGVVSNMYEIAAAMTGAGKLVIP
jgi:TusA-related sulfurtransferase